MGLVTAKEVAKAINTDKYGVFGTFSGWLLMKVLKISTLNKIYDRNKHLSNVEFLNAILDEFQIKFEILEVYKGRKYSDTAISEIFFDGYGVH